MYHEKYSYLCTSAGAHNEKERVETTNADAYVGIKLGVVPVGKSDGGGSIEEGTGLVNISTSRRTFCSN